MHIPRSVVVPLLGLALGTLACMPAAVAAADAVPEEMVDPPAAMGPELEVRPAQPRPAPQVQAVAGATAAPSRDTDARPQPRPSAAAVQAAPPAPVGTLPFTGPDPGRMLLLFLAGSLLLLGGVVAHGYARAAAELG